MEQFSKTEERIVQELVDDGLEGDPPDGYDDLPDARKKAVVTEANLRIKRRMETLDQATD